MTKVIYYTTISGENPTQKFLDSIQKQDKAKVMRIFRYMEAYGLLSVLPHVKRLEGTFLWEIRVLGKANIRVIYIAFQQDAILVLHGFLKKKQKTPSKEIATSEMRAQEWFSRLNTS